jgi:hypothetical protein
MMTRPARLSQRMSMIAPIDVETWIEQNIPYSLEDARARGLIPTNWRP